jgi:O-antigen polymerase
MSMTAHIILALIITATLVSSDYFINASLAAYFFFVIAASVLFAITGIYFVTNKKLSVQINFLPLILLFLLAGYYFFQTLLSAKAITTIHIYLFKNEILNNQSVFNIISVAAIVESLICVFQFGGLIKSQNQFIKVSGTWENPNVTAMFLSMSLPAILSNTIFKKYTATIWFNRCFAAVILIAITLLKCRTAFIGSLVVLTIFLNQKYNVSNKLKEKYSFSKQLLLLFLSLVLIIPVAIYAYKWKQNSADGRKLVWKISAFMFTQNHITGIGFGNFEHDYNLQQAEYFAQGKGSSEEINNAGFVNMAYNEFLQNAVEGGVIALLLFSAFIFSLFASSTKQKQPIPPPAALAVSGIAAFAAMSFFNFSVQAIPVMCLFIIYAALIISNSKSIVSFTFFQNKKFVSAILSLSGILIFATQISLANAFAKTKVAINLSKDGFNAEAVEALKPLSSKMQNCEAYWVNFGNALSNQKDYKKALFSYKKASTITSSPFLYMNIGNIYFKLHQFDSAINSCTTAKNIMPSRLKPRYALMKIYEAKNDTANAIQTAKELIAMQPKFQSKEADYYKEDALKTLSVYNSKNIETQKQ